MAKKMRTVGIIPARGGSKGIPYKNIQKLCGRPLISYTIEAALKSKSLKRVIVSTEDTRIAEISRSFGAEVPFLRPAELAKDDTPSLKVIQHAVKYIEDIEHCVLDVIVILQPTSPLRNEKCIDAVVEKIMRTGADSVVTVCSVKQHPYWNFTIKRDRIFPLISNDIKPSRRQDLPEMFAPNGAVYVVRRDVLFNQNSILGKDTRALVMPVEESVDIDDYFDWFIAEMTLKYWVEWSHEKGKDWK